MTGPLVKKYFIKVNPPDASDPAADLERVLRGLDRSVAADLAVPLSVAATLSAALRASSFQVTATIAFTDPPRLIDVEAGDTSSINYGLAIDLGTTNVVGALMDLNSGVTAGELSETNPQVEFGEDILSRIHHCLNEGGLEELRAKAVGCMNSIARRLAEGAGIAPEKIGSVSVSGNTTMSHLFLGLDPYNICRAPYVPVANRFGILSAEELGLSVNPRAPVYVLPNVGSYVGGDVLAGVLVSGIHGSDKVSLLVDVGTNAEIIIGNRDWLMACAGAAGPALEGGVVKFGMRAMPGAIERVKVNPETFEPVYSVVGGDAAGKPRGLCGSALIDLLAELFTTGLIDGRGKFKGGARTGRIKEVDGRKAYVVVFAPDTAEGVDIVFTETDIENLIRTKAAMYTALNVVTRELGIGFNELENFYIAGTFGAYIAADKAVAIGMVPDIEQRKFVLLGNSSLTGASEVLIERGRIREIEEIASMITYKELNVSTDFMSEFRAAMFLPHTDASLFPSVAKAEN
jgi:uncharacterized 2Fe-2S/4Fe-4S cluster protein (DUF4445 family)